LDGTVARRVTASGESWIPKLFASDADISLICLVISSELMSMCFFSKMGVILPIGIEAIRIGNCDWDRGCPPRGAAPQASPSRSSSRRPGHDESVGEYRGDPLYHAGLSPDEYTALVDSIGFEVIAQAVEDWQTGGGRTVWLTRVRANHFATGRAPTRR
jgi:hypothetical protein